MLRRGSISLFSEFGIITSDQGGILTADVACMFLGRETKMSYNRYEGGDSTRDMQIADVSSADVGVTGRR